MAPKCGDPHSQFRVLAFGLLGSELYGFGGGT